MQPDLRTPENSRRNQLRKPGHHYDIEENDDGEETRKKSTDTTDGPKTIPTCTVETRTSIAFEALHGPGNTEPYDLYDSKFHPPTKEGEKP